MPSNPPPLARILNSIMTIIIVVIVIWVLIMLALALLMQFPNSMRDGFIAQLEATGGEMPSLTSLALHPVIATIVAGAYLYVAIVVKAIVKTTLQGDPFVESNISRLRKTWIVIACVEIFRMVAMALLPSAPGQAAVALSSFSVDTKLSAWFLVFVIAVMAEVFRIGLELRRDQELTV